jgi:hypothetical protein
MSGTAAKMCGIAARIAWTVAKMCGIVGRIFGIAGRTSGIEEGCVMEAAGKAVQASGKEGSIGMLALTAPHTLEGRTGAKRLLGSAGAVVLGLCFAGFPPAGRVSAASDEERPGAAHAIQLRTGIWVVQPVPKTEAQLQRFATAVREHRDLSGVILHADWNEIEPAPGSYEVGGFDRAIAILHHVGKPYKLGVKPGTGTPPWVYQAGAAAFPFVVANPHRPTYGEPITIPVPWDPVYQSHFFRLITALGERYSSDPLCISVAITGANALSAEMGLPKRPEDLARWRSLGDYRGRLLEVYQRLIDAWAGAFPRQELSLHLSKVLDLKADELVEPVIDYGLSAYPQRFAIQENALSGRREGIGREPYDVIMRYRERVHHGFQSVAGFLHQGERMGSVEMAALNVVHAGGAFWELWHGDGMSLEISQQVATVWGEATRMGYEAYRGKLIAEGRYREVADDRYPQHVRALRRQQDFRRRGTSPRSPH